MSLFSSLKLKAKSETKPDLNHFQVGHQRLPIVRTTRKKSIALKTRPAGVAILVPKHFSNKRLLALLTGHHEWLHKTLNTLEMRYASSQSMSLFKGKKGDILEFLGAKTVFRIQHNETAPYETVADVLIEDATCSLYWNEQHYGQLSADDYATQVCQNIQAFMHKQAVEYLEPKLAHYAQKIGVKPKSLTVKGYKSRWGSCYADGRIQFNWRLMQAPSWVIDYVVVHELCHLVHANHSKDFWALVNQHYPQTPEAKLVMKTHGARWIQLLA
ncbi:M48 family metallopeptidase [Thiomicrorhabdus arctica]|uniref:M48 family metallopeptidase n=1 Tax=Thiomicrorhabdus arctica TaxID=131540 RepID=UPI000375BC6B|nr:SprT family zinc-dependent metalloprotease [Thiomicrorhabdus arctica]